MAWEIVPLPKLIYRSADEQQIGGQVGARLINGYIDELGHIRKRPGITSLANLGTGGIIGLYWWEAKNVLIAVMKGDIYKISSSAGTNTDLGGTDLQTNRHVSFATDGSDLVMANGAQMIVYNNSDAPFAMPADDAPTTVSHVSFKDGYLLCTDIATNGRINFSSPLDIQSWTASDIFTSETNPDAIQFLDTRWREVTIFGEKGIDVYFNDGITPFTRLDGAYLERGCIAKNSVQMLDSGWIWLDDLRRVTTMAGRQPQNISSPFDDQIRAIANVNSASSFIIDHGVRKFYGLTFPDDDRTFVYDRSTQAWAEWGIWEDNRWKKYPALTSEYATAWNLNLIGDYNNGKVYKVVADNFQDDGVDIRTLVRTGHIDHGTSNRKRSKELRIRMKRGDSGLATRDKINLRWRDDNGPWSSWHTRDMGRSGDTDFYIKFKRMGIYRTRQYEFSHGENSDFILIGMEENIENLGR